MLKNKIKKLASPLYQVKVFVAVIGLTVIASFTFISLVEAYRFIKDPVKQHEFAGIAVPRNALAEIETLPMKDYVLKRIEQAGINPAEADKIINCESKWNDQSIGINAKHGSADLGLWQINNKFHPKITPACMLDYKCATEEAIKIYKARGWTAWTCQKAL